MCYQPGIDKGVSGSYNVQISESAVGTGKGHRSSSIMYTGFYLGILIDMHISYNTFFPRRLFPYGLSLHGPIYTMIYTNPKEAHFGMPVFDNWRETLKPSDITVGIATSSLAPSDS